MEVSVCDKRPWLFQVRFRRDEGAIREEFKRLPCWSVDPRTWSWFFPRYLTHELERLVDQPIPEMEYSAPKEQLDLEGLLPHQIDALKRSQRCHSGKRFIFADGTGGGKSVEAIRFVGRPDVKRLLVVCPASVRGSWEEQLEQWAPPHLKKAYRITHTRDRTRGISAAKREYKEKAYAADVVIVSYNLLSQLPVEPWDAVIFDEAHRMQSPTVQWTRFARAISVGNPDARVAVLSATIAPTRPLDCFGPVDVCYPGIFGGVTNTTDGRPYRFKVRYTNITVNSHGYTVYDGLNEAFLPELQGMLEKYTASTPKAVFAKHLPALVVKTRPLVDSSVTEAVADFVADARLVGEPCLVYTHTRKSAARLAMRVNGVCVTGELSPEKRNEILAGRPNVVVATMDSVGTGINGLAYMERVLVAELAHLSTTIQAIGRVNRLNSTRGATVEILRTDDQKKLCSDLASKLQDLSRVLNTGADSDALLTALGQSDEDFQADLDALLNFDFEEEDDD